MKALRLLQSGGPRPGNALVGRRVGATMTMYLVEGLVEERFVGMKVCVV